MAGRPRGPAAAVLRLIGDFPVAHPAALTAPIAALIAAADRRMSSSVVDQFETENLIAGSPCQLVPPSQQVPSRWTASTTAAGLTPGTRNSTWFSTTSFSSTTAPSRPSLAAASLASAQHRSTSSAAPRRPSERSAA